MEPALCLAFDDVDLAAWVVLLWDAVADLDVFDREPLPEGHPFFRLENLLLSPHCADHTPDWLDNAMRFFIAQLERFRSGKDLLNIVDKRLGY